MEAGGAAGDTPSPLWPAPARPPFIFFFAPSQLPSLAPSLPLELLAARGSLALSLSSVGSSKRCELWETATPLPARDLSPGPAPAQPCPARGGRRRRRGRTDG